jgi:pyruvoyl-dependent arginine decarboxylase (PvlArgDC)
LPKRWQPLQASPQLREGVVLRFCLNQNHTTAKAHQLTDSDSLTVCWLSIRDTHTTLAEAHSSFARKLQSEVVKPLADDIRDRSTQKNALADEDRNLHNQLHKTKIAAEV